MVSVFNISWLIGQGIQLNSKQGQNRPWWPDHFTVGVFIAVSSRWAAWAVLEGLENPSAKMNISQVGDMVGSILNTSSSEHLR
jgi:hypothetical protein